MRQRYRGAICALGRVGAAHQGREDDALLLLRVRDRVALAGTGAGWASDIAKLDALGEQFRHPALRDRPGAHVSRLLLAPDDLLEVRIARDQLVELFLGER